MNPTKSPPTHPITKGKSTEYLAALFFFTVAVVRFECRLSKQHRTLKQSPIRDEMAPSAAAGGDAIVSTHTIPKEEQARRSCWIIRNRDRNDLRVASPLCHLRGNIESSPPLRSSQPISLPTKKIRKKVELDQVTTHPSNHEWSQSTECI